MLVRGRYVIADPARENGVIEDGAVCFRGNRIVAVGKYNNLKKLYPSEDEIGSDNYVVTPGLVNAHDHGRAPSALQLGVADDYLELWMIGLLGQADVPPYLATAYASAQLIESGITTTLHSYYDANPVSYETTLEEIARAYEDSGLRTVLALGTLDRSPISDACERLLPRTPVGLRARVLDSLGKRSFLSPDDFFTIFNQWHRRYSTGESRHINVFVGPVSVHWCSDGLLTRLRDEAEAAQTGIHTHALETVYQRQTSLKEYGKTAVEHLAEIGFLGPHLSCAHCVWVTERDIEILAESRTSVIHNASSNLRLHSGIAPVNEMLREGLNVGLGMDSNSLNDDGDMLQEMRLAANLHRIPGVGAEYPTANQVLMMATRGGAQALMQEDDIGTLHVGKKADIVLLCLDRISFPYVDPRLGIRDLVLYRGKAEDVDTVIIDGEVVMRGRKLLKIDKQAIVAEMRDYLASALKRRDENFAKLAEAIKTHARELYMAEKPDVSPAHYIFNCKEGRCIP